MTYVTISIIYSSFGFISSPPPPPPPGAEQFPYQPHVAANTFVAHILFVANI